MYKHTHTHVHVSAWPSRQLQMGERVVSSRWGLLLQAHACTRKDLEKIYPGFPKFCSIREKLDPTGMFLNTYLEKVLY